jgi:hypothetical protein
MPTPDGISSRDWDEVHTLALLSLKASLSSNKKAEKSFTQRMLKYLRWLEDKYGQLPSILATRADYISGNRAKERLFLRAYRMSTERKDVFNQTEIAHSLAMLYIEEWRQYQEGLKWLKQLKAHIRGLKSEYLEEEYGRLYSLARKGKASRSKS